MQNLIVKFLIVEVGPGSRLSTCDKSLLHAEVSFQLITLASIHLGSAVDYYKYVRIGEQLANTKCVPF